MFDVNNTNLDELRSSLRIAVIYSGSADDAGNVINVTHNPRGWKSYKSGAEDIAEALLKCGFTNVSVFPEGRDLRELLEKRKINFAWLNCAGLQGFDGMCHAPSMLESLGIPYVGHRPSQSALLDNKYYFKMFIESLGVPTATFMVWDSRKTSSRLTSDPLFRHKFRGYSGAFIVKPVSGRASNNVLYVDNISQLDESIAHLNDITNNEVLIEKYLPGREFCVAAGAPWLLGQRLTNASEQQFNQPHCFSRIERLFPDGKEIFTSMDKVPISKSRIKLLNIERESVLVAELDRLTTSVYKALSLTAMVRADLRQGEDGCTYFLEINPKPDLRNVRDGKGSIIALGLEQSKLSYEELIVNQLYASVLNTIYLSPRSAPSLLEEIGLKSIRRVSSYA